MSAVLAGFFAQVGCDGGFRLEIGLVRCAVPDTRGILGGGRPTEFVVRSCSCRVLRKPETRYRLLDTNSSTFPLSALSGLPVSVGLFA